MPSASASAGKGQSSQLRDAPVNLGWRERSTFGVGGPSGALEPFPTPVGAACTLRTALFEEPLLAVIPPAKRSPVPVMKPSPVRSTGSSGSGSAVRILPASAAAGGGAVSGFGSVRGGGGGG